MKPLFMSHVKEDSEIALQLAESMALRGFAAWCYEVDSLPGLSYLETTQRAIDECRALLLLVSLHSMWSHQVRVELERAHVQDKPVIPVLHGVSDRDYKARNPLWAQIVGTRTSIAFTLGSLELVADRIAEALPMILRDPQPPPTSPLLPIGEDFKAAWAELQGKPAYVRSCFLREYVDYAKELVRQKRWKEVAPILFEMLAYAEFNWRVFYSENSILALLASDYPVEKVRERAQRTLEEMALNDDFMYYLLHPLQKAEVISADECLEWYRRVVDSHDNSNENRGYYVSALINSRDLFSTPTTKLGKSSSEEAIGHIRRGCAIDSAFFKYSGEKYYRFMRANGRGAEAEELMTASNKEY